MMIKLKNLTKVYRTEEVESTALNEVSFEIKQGEFVSIMGPSGCGKSTLLNILGMLDKPESGSYEFQGTEISKLNEKGRSGIRKKNIGFIFQNFNLIDELTVFENIELPLIYTQHNTKQSGSPINAANTSMNGALLNVCLSWQ